MCVIEFCSRWVGINLLLHHILLTFVVNYTFYLSQYAVLAADDIVKIDLGAHIDGFIVLAAHTVIVGQDAATAEAVATGRRAAVINATYTAAEVAAKLIKNGTSFLRIILLQFGLLFIYRKSKLLQAFTLLFNFSFRLCIGNSNSAVTAAIKQVADMYDVRPISGTLMHQMKQYVIDGKKMILLKELEQDQQKVEACTFETGEVYAIDIAMSTGDGKPRDMGMRTTVYKRAVDQKYALKNQASRAFFNEVNKRYPTLPFSTRSLPDEKAAKLGVRECVTHGLMLPYPVLHERKGDFVAHTKFTVLLLPNGTLQITGLPPVTFNALVASGKVSAEGVQTLNGNIGKILFEQYQAENPDAKLPENIAEILNEKKPENKKKAKKAAKAAAAVATA